MPSVPAALSPAEFTLTATKAAEYLGCHPDTVKRWAKQGKVRSFKTPGGWYRFRPADLDHLLRTPAA